MKTRLQTILETVDNLMEYRVPSDQDGNKRDERLRDIRGSRVSPPSTRPLGSIEPNPNYFPYDVSRTVYDSQQVIRRPRPTKRPSTEVSIGLLGAGNSVSGYDSGSDTPTSKPRLGSHISALRRYNPHPDRNPYEPPRLPPSRFEPDLTPDIDPGSGKGRYDQRRRPSSEWFGYRPDSRPDTPYRPGNQPKEQFLRAEDRPGTYRTPEQDKKRMEM
jgi:hypothetical protein